MSEWKENPHAGVRKIPEDVSAWIKQGGALDVRAEGGQEYWNADAVTTFGGLFIVTHYRLVPTEKQKASTHE